MPTTHAGPLAEAELAVDRIVGNAERLPDVTKALLAAIGVPLGFELAAAWRPEATWLRLTEVWSDESVGGPELAAVCAVDRLASGEGLPGRVWATSEPAWIVDVAEDRNFPRRAAA